MIFTRDFVTRKNNWQITSLGTTKSSFTITHALFFMSSLPQMTNLSETAFCVLVLLNWEMIPTAAFSALFTECQALTCLMSNASWCARELFIVTTGLLMWLPLFTIVSTATTRHYQEKQMDYYDHQTDLTFELHSQQLIWTLTLLGAGSEWTQLHDKCQQIWLKSNLVNTRNVLWDIDHSHWTQLNHRLNYFPGPQTRPSSQIVDPIVYCLTLGFVPVPELVLFEYRIYI